MRAVLPRALRSPSFQLGLLSLALAAANFARAEIGPLQESIQRAWSLSDTEIAWIQGPALALPALAGALPLGVLIARLNRARLLAVFIATTAVCTVMSAAMQGFGWLLAIRCLTGLATAGTSITVLAMLADVFPPNQRGRATMAVTVAEVGGASAAFAAGGFLLAHGFGLVDPIRGVLLGMAPPLVVAAAIMLLAIESRRENSRSSKKNWRDTLDLVWRYRRIVLPLVAGKILVGTAYGAVVVWAAPAFMRRFSVMPSRVGEIVAACLLVSGLLGPVIGGLVADVLHRLGGPRRTFAGLTVLALASGPAGAFAVMPSTLLMTAGLVVFMTLVSTAAVIEMTVTIIVVPEEVRPLCLSVLISAGLLFGVGIAPLVVSTLSRVYGGPLHLPQALSSLCSLTGVLAALTFSLAPRWITASADPTIHS